MCGVISKERDLCVTMLKRQKAGRKEEESFELTPVTPREQTEDPAPVQRLRFRIGRTGETRWLSHLEQMNAWTRALRRARVPMAYSQGFHAHPKVSFATAAPVGEESIGDYMDVFLKKRADAAELLAAVKAVLPEGLRAFDVEEVHLKAPSLMSAASGFAYTLYADGDAEAVRARIEEILAAEEIIVERKVKAKNKKRRRGRQNSSKATKEVNIRPMIERLELIRAEGRQVEIALETAIVENRSVRTREIVALMGLDTVTTRALKRDTFLAVEAPASV